MKTLVLFFSLIPFYLMAFEGTIVKLNGDVKISGMPIKQDFKIKEGQEIEAIGKSSFIHVKFTDGSAVLLRDGKLVVSKLERKGTTLNLLKGTIFNYVNKTTQTNFKVIGKQGAMAVRGTTFYVQELEDATYLCVCEGDVEFSRESEKVLVSKNEDLWARQNKQIKKQMPNPDMWKMAVEGFTLMGISVK